MINEIFCPTLIKKIADLEKESYCQIIKVVWIWMPPGLDATRQMTDLNEIVDHHRQKYVETTKDCLWNELQNYFVESTGKKN